MVWQILYMPPSLVIRHVLLACVVSSLRVDTTEEFHGQRQLTSSKYHGEILKPLAAILRTMKWREILIIYENMDSVIIVNIARYLEVNHSNILHTLLNVDALSLETVAFFLIQKYREVGGKSTVPVLIIARSQKMLNILKMVDELDFRSNKTTNYRTNSFWVVISDKSFIHDELSSCIFNMKNIILLDCHSDNTTTKILTVPDMQEVPEDGGGDKSQEVKLFPNSVFKYCKRHLVVSTLKSTNMRHHVIDGEYKGFLAEMFKLMAESLNFTYTFVEPSDGRYGEKLENSSWNGLVGQLERHEVDIVVAELTILAERLEVVDYIFPSFHRQAFGIVYKRSTSRGRDSSWVRIFRPLHVCVYILVLLAIIFVSILLSITESSNTSGAERSSSRQVILVRSKQLLDFCLILLGFISARGDGVQSRQASTRFLIASFWLLCIVITGVYVGNLTASLSDTRVKAPFNSLRDLSRLTDWKWGLRGKTLAVYLMNNTSSSVLRSIWNKILEFNKTDPDVLGHESSSHIHKLYTEDKYAFLVADPQAVMANETECTFEILDGVISDLGLSIAVSKDSYLCADLHRVMVKLTDSGIVEHIKQKHLNEKYRPNRGTCNAKQPLRAMQLEDTLGSFLVLIVGLILGAVVLLLEGIVCYLF